MEENVGTKEYYVEKYIESLEDRSKKLWTLSKQGYSLEATLLCCCYIEGIAHLLYGDSHPKKSFFDVIRKYGKETALLQIYPTHLKNELNKIRGTRQIGAKIANILEENRHNLCGGGDILNLVDEALDEKEKQKLEKNLWHGTLASLLYTEIRCPLVHEFSAQTSITLSSVNNQPDLPLSFGTLYATLMYIHNNCKDDLRRKISARF